MFHITEQIEPTLYISRHVYKFIFRGKSDIINCFQRVTKINLEIKPMIKYLP